MMLSTVWIGLSLALSVDGHPASAVLPLIAWAFHRGMESKSTARRGPHRK